MRSKGKRLLFVLLGLLVHAVVVVADPPGLTLANVYQKDASTELADYWVSEKYDGVRAYWDGRRLVSRGGKVFAAPSWFVAGLPPVPLDGELWLARGRFEDTVSIVRRQAPHEGWRNIRYMVFDLPQHGGIFRERYFALLALAAQSDTGDPVYWRVVEQRPIVSLARLEASFDALILAGGEGLMLRRITSLYRSGRSDDLLKYKPFDDAEAVVIGHNPGKGKYTGKVGSLRVETPDGRVFNVGSGLSDAEREQPPSLGTVVTYQHQGVTKKGLPRFPVFLRIRLDE